MLPKRSPPGLFESDRAGLFTCSTVWRASGMNCMVPARPKVLRRPWADASGPATAPPDDAGMEAELQAVVPPCPNLNRGGIQLPPALRLTIITPRWANVPSTSPRIRISPSAAPVGRLSRRVPRVAPPAMADSTGGHGRGAHRRTARCRSAMRRSERIGKRRPTQPLPPPQRKSPARGRA